MSNPIAIPRKFIIFAITLPLAAMLGYLLTTPDELQTWAFLGMIVIALSIPFILKWHKPLLLWSWNSGVVIFLLPGTPQAWMLLSLVTLGLTLLGALLNKEQKLINVPCITWTLIFLAAVVIFTAKATGGLLGMQAFGGSVYGGKRYYYILFGILAYFAISTQRISRQEVPLALAAFFLGGLTMALSNLIYLAGPDFYFLYAFFPAEYAVSQAMEDMSELNVIFGRLSGVTWAGLGAFCYMMVRYGIRGIFDLKKPWRLCLWSAFIVLSLWGGFRSVLAIYFLIFVVQYYFERLIMTKLTLYLGVAAVLVAAMLIPLASKMPMSVQRSLSFLPLDVDPVARRDAQGSTEWRLRMWTLLLPDIPKYLWVGKGYTASPTDYYLALESTRRGLAEGVEMALVAGDYHNGPLSIIIPFGIWGALGFLAFLWAAIFVLYRNYRYGDPDLRIMNVFLLSAFIARTIFFFVVFGAINSDIPLFAGLVGLSVAINGGVAKVRDLDPAEERQLEAPPSPA